MLVALLLALMYSADATVSRKRTSTKATFDSKLLGDEAALIQLVIAKCDRKIAPLEEQLEVYSQVLDEETLSEKLRESLRSRIDDMRYTQGKYQDLRARVIQASTCLVPRSRKTSFMDEFTRESLCSFKLEIVKSLVRVADVYTQELESEQKLLDEASDKIEFICNIARIEDFLESLEQFTDRVACAISLEDPILRDALKYITTINPSSQ